MFPLFLYRFVQKFKPVFTFLRFLKFLLGFQVKIQDFQQFIIDLCMLYLGQACKLVAFYLIII